MKKIIIATHHNMAIGLKDTLEYIVPDTVEVIAINAYIENISVEKQVEEALEQFNKDEQIFVFTDLLGGSVNQEFVKKLGEYNIELFSGANLPLIMTVVLGLGTDIMEKKAIRNYVTEAQNQLVYVNDYLAELEMDDDDE